MDPKGQGLAAYYYQEALRLPVLSQGHCLTPTPASYAERYNALTVIYDPAKEQGFRDQSNQPVSSNVSSAKHFYSADVVGQELTTFFRATSSQMKHSLLNPPGGAPSTKVQFARTRTKDMSGQTLRLLNRMRRERGQRGHRCLHRQVEDTPSAAAAVHDVPHPNQ
jgi:hypothetical protein